MGVRFVLADHSRARTTDGTISSIMLAEGWRGGEVSIGGPEGARWRSAATGPRSHVRERFQSGFAACPSRAQSKRGPGSALAAPRPRDLAVPDDAPRRDPRVRAHQVAAEARERGVLARGEVVRRVPDQLDPDGEVVAPRAPAPAAGPGVVGRAVGRDELRDAAAAVDQEVRRELLPRDLAVGGVPRGVERAEEELLDVLRAEVPRRAGDVSARRSGRRRAAAVAVVRARESGSRRSERDRLVLPARAASSPPRRRAG